MLANGGRGPSTYQFEISQLREDNARLLSILRKTKEFKDFNGFVADSGGKVRTLAKDRSASQNKRSNSAANNQSKNPKSRFTNTNLILIDEQKPGEQDNDSYEELRDGWIPNDAYVLAHTFRQKFGNELTPELVNDLLRDLNKIWHEREKKQLIRLKLEKGNEINTLKRKLTHRTPLDEVVSKKNISTLRKQVT